MHGSFTTFTPLPFCSLEYRLVGFVILVKTIPSISKKKITHHNHYTHLLTLSIHQEKYKKEMLKMTMYSRQLDHHLKGITMHYNVRLDHFNPNLWRKLCTASSSKNFTKVSIIESNEEMSAIYSTEVHDLVLIYQNFACIPPQLKFAWYPNRMNSHSFLSSE